MGSYRVTVKPSVAKDLKRLDRSAIPRIIEAIERLGQDPLPGSSKKLIGAERTYRIRVGDYRVVYIFDRTIKEVEIQRVRHRKEVYRS